LVPNKNVDRLLEAFALATKRGSIRSLTLVGDGPERQRLEKLAVRLGVHPLTRFLGDLPDDAKWRLLIEEADIFISASRREGLAIATLEALAAGNPAIISYTPGGPQQGATEYMRHGQNGLITDGTVPSLAAAMDLLAWDQELYESLSKNAIDTARRYTWDSAASQLEQIYERAISVKARVEPALLL
jgi:glycosyltransferase involved in cell wall biosynthesis